MSERPTYPIGINIFVIKDNALLLGKRRGSSGEGTWGLPGGHLEFGESMISAAKRELKEETSLEADTFKFMNLVNDNGNQRKHYVQVAFAAENLRGELKLTEPDRCYEWKWFLLDSLPKEIFFGHQKQVELFLDKILFGDSEI